ncbi:hypothetical protein C8F04DRAFT_1241169 [Mycena alexandri]|uniref:Uncharacterized protein n=1 Tax=Mycena alexandri TaxID=1745969 RepID=A0AAD6WSB0_9AGAR|nr:hypothetical protein C8F04DRAFT_1241169 [Mycena alexandri]
MVQISRTVAFFALVSTALALVLSSDAATSITGVVAGHSHESARALYLIPSDLKTRF